MRLAIIGDPALLQTLWSTPNEAFRWGHRFNVIGFVVGPGSMIVSDGADHRRRRSAVQIGFSRRRLNRWIPMIVAATDAAIDDVVVGTDRGPREMDLYPVGRRLVLDVAVTALFGERIAEQADRIGELFEAPQRYLESPAIRQVPHPLPFTARARVRADRAALDRIIDAEIAELRQRHPVDGSEDADEVEGIDDVLGVLVRDATLSDAEIRDQVVTLMGAGFHTTAASLAWILRRATLEPDLWARLRAEANDVLGPPGSRPDGLDHTHLARLELASAVMHETLRLHPAGLFAPREAVTDLALGSHRIPRGTLLLWSPYLAGRDPAVWSDPLRFDPGRFQAPTAAQQAIIDRAWVPFGRGPRQCIGFALAQMELVLILARIAQRLDLTPTSTVVPRPVGMVVNRPDGGVPVLVAPRPAPGVDR